MYMYSKRQKNIIDFNFVLKDTQYTFIGDFHANTLVISYFNYNVLPICCVS